MNIYAALGYIGASLVLISYIQVTRGRWKPKSYIFQLANVVGAAFLIVYGVYEATYPNVVLNVVWLAVALTAVYKLHNR